MGLVEMGLKGLPIIPGSQLVIDQVSDFCNESAEGDSGPRLPLFLKLIANPSELFVALDHTHGKISQLDVLEVNFRLELFSLEADHLLFGPQLLLLSFECLLLFDLKLVPPESLHEVNPQQEQDQDHGTTIQDIGKP